MKAVAFLLFAWSIGQGAMAQTMGSIQGKVTDVSGAAILGAVVTAQEETGGDVRTTVTDNEGAFEISSLRVGPYKVKISANGLSNWIATDVNASVNAGDHTLLAVMNVASTATTLTVGIPREEVAWEQVKREEKQRTIGIFPNFFVTYEQHPASLSAVQKMHLGMRTLLDPTTFILAGVAAGIQQKNNSYYQYGQGAEGFAKRYGARYADAADGTFVGILTHVAFRQDPRYFYSGQGTPGQRFRYALLRAFTVKGDNGKWQPPYASLAAAVASAEISQTYLPDPRTQYTLLGRTLLFYFPGRIASNLLQEFVRKKFTTNTPPDRSAASHPVLREGTPVTLIAVNEVSAATATAGGVMGFVVSKELTVDGKVVVRTGAVALGQVSQVNAAQLPDTDRNIWLTQVKLEAGSVNVPLRSNRVPGTTGSVQYKMLPGSGKMEVTLYVAQSVRLPED